VKAETQSFYLAAVRRAIAHVVGRLDEALDLDELARVAALSPFHFHRIFRGMVGETPLELRRRLRTERAAHRSLSGDGRVTAVALEAGYDTHEAFTRAFRAPYGAPPSTFRRARPGGAPACAAPRPAELAARSGIPYRPGAAAAADAAVVVAGDGPLPAGLAELRLTAGRDARARHVGPYAGLGDAWGRFMGRWLSQSGHRLGDGQSYEIYANTPLDAPPPGLVTDLYLPLA
jgi:AraC family transcriptional regulator